MKFDSWRHVIFWKYLAKASVSQGCPMVVLICPATAATLDSSMALSSCTSSKKGLIYSVASACGVNIIDRGYSRYDLKNKGCPIGFKLMTCVSTICKRGHIVESCSTCSCERHQKIFVERHSFEIHEEIIFPKN